MWTVTLLILDVEHRTGDTKLFRLQRFYSGSGIEAEESSEFCGMVVGWDPGCCPFSLTAHFPSLVV